MVTVGRRQSSVHYNIYTARQVLNGREYRAIRQFAVTHLQQQTILEVAQVDATQIKGYQEVVYRTTQDL